MKKITNKGIWIRLAALLLIASFMLGLASCNDVKFPSVTPPQSTPKAEESGDTSGIFDALTLIDKLFRDHTLFETDDEALVNAVLKGYIEGTGDKYAEYFTEEEYASLTSQNKGELVGVGISVVKNTESGYPQIINVFEGSPAFDSGVLPGDIIAYVGIGEERQSVTELGYTIALDLLSGAEGTNAEFVVLRDGEEIEFSITRRKVNVTAVSHRTYVPESGERVGIVKITEFDLTTPVALKSSVEELLAGGCEYIIFDVRNNPGGDLNSIVAVLAFFLDEGDVVIRTSDRDKNESVQKIYPVKYSGDYAGCSIAKEDIGIYKDLNCAVLTNGNTASAAELFSAALKDHQVSFTVGTTTYGKGTMQSIITLERYGYKGALKLTTKYYYPPFSDSYEGIGIPADVEVELSEELKGTNIYLIKDEEDNQLAAAIEALAARKNAQ